MRRAGILLHPTSLPGPYGMGDIGPRAREFVDWLEAAGQTLWQFLPIHPVDKYGSPYASPSAFAFNPLLISIDDLVVDGLIRQSEKPYLPDWGRLSHDQVVSHKMPALMIAADRLRAQMSFDDFIAQNSWLKSWSLYAALAEENGTHFTRWPAALRDRDPESLAEATERLADAIERQVALQWLFIKQWRRLRAHAAARGIQLIGDLPFLVSGESCDVWEHRQLFVLNADGTADGISGVPPDAFSPVGQTWGHPLYANQAHANEGYQWWADRTEHLLGYVDSVRLDHFRGIEAVWRIPSNAPNATHGAWQPGLGSGLLTALQDRLGPLPIIAEDLGVITPEVEALRDQFGLPGMAILQFAFGKTNHAYLPHNHRTDQVVYTGTHDNDTAIGWYYTADYESKDRARRYLSVNGQDIAGDLIRAAMRSVCETAIVPMQDALGLDGHSRMNLPGEAAGNWNWRMSAGSISMNLAQRLRDDVVMTGRLP